MGLLAFSALFAAAAQAYFAFLELCRWGVPFVDKQTRGWDRPISQWLSKREPKQPAREPAAVRREHAVELAELTALCVAWGKHLATNLGVYNLLIALALLWTAIEARYGWASAAHLGVILGLFLIGAGLAAWATAVPKAFILQTALGLLVLASALYAA